MGGKNGENYLILRWTMIFYFSSTRIPISEAKISWIFISVTRLIISHEYIYITFQIRFANLHTSIYSTFVGTFIERL